MRIRRLIIKAFLTDFKCTGGEKKKIFPLFLNFFQGKVQAHLVNIPNSWNPKHYVSNYLFNNEVVNGYVLFPTITAKIRKRCGE